MRLHSQYQLGSARGLVALVGHKRIFGRRRGQRQPVAERKFYGGKRLRRGLHAYSAPLDVQLFDVDFGYGKPRAERRALGDYAAVFGDDVMPGKHQVGDGLARARIGVNVRAVLSARHAAHELTAVFGFADGLVGRGKIDYNVRARTAKLDRRRHVRPHILANLATHDKIGVRAAFEYQLAHGRAQRLDGLHAVERGREIPFLVKLAVIGQLGFGNKPQKPAVGNRDGAVIQAPLVRDWRAEKSEHVLGRGGGNLANSGYAAVQKLASEQQIHSGVAAQAQLGKHDDFRALRRQLFHARD